MTTGRSVEFRYDAVRIALTSGLTRRQVSSDLGVGLSPLNKWIKNHGDEGLVDTADADLLRENERLRCEIPLTGSTCLHV
jgi:transposase